jgi:hypothetical protein
MWRFDIGLTTGVFYEKIAPHAKEVSFLTVI